MAIPVKYNLRNLVARKTSTGMTAFVIGLVVAVFLCVLALVQGVTRTLSVTASNRNVLDDARRLAGRDAERHHARPGRPDPGAAGHRAQRGREALRLAGAPDADQRPARGRQDVLERPGPRHGADRHRDPARREDRRRADVHPRDQRGDRLAEPLEALRGHEGRRHDQVRKLPVGGRRPVRRRRAAPTSRRSGPT